MNHYDTLGVDHGATPEEIKRAYRKLAKKHHPDMNPGDDTAAERFKAVAAAYEVLGDAERRSEYDLPSEIDLFDVFAEAFGAD